MDVFKLRDHVIQEYADYTKSFLSIEDPIIREYVHNQLGEGKLWPDALVQLSPSYEQTQTVAELVSAEVLHPLCQPIFQVRDRDGELQSLRLYQHQRRAIDFAAQCKPFVVTSGTGSGKSLTYIIPIIDYILKHDPTDRRVRAIIVYPMNALINSQDKAIERFLSHLPETQRGLIRYERYTGQESEAEKSRIRDERPHILLTNYVMLELMLTRPEEAVFVDRATAGIEFIVLDELHTYRGRQGADVAMLMRRLRERSGNPNLLCIGTSATMASGGSSEDRRGSVAHVASKIFGVDLTPDQVIEETLVRAVSGFYQPTDLELRNAVLNPLPDSLAYSSFQQHPLAAWIESTYSVQSSQVGVLRRADPRRLRSGAELLADRTGLDVEVCEARIRDFFRLSSQVKDTTGKPGFAFKLHQFVSQGGAAYATLEPPETRELTLEGQRFIAGPRGDRLLYPLVFCRECGQHYYMCAYNRSTQMLEPRLPMSRGEDVEEPAVPGYLLVGDDIWQAGDEERLPDSWYNISRRGRHPKRDFADFIPQRLYARFDGAAVGQGAEDAVGCWFLRMPFLTCLNCGVVYTKQNRDDFRKLARLSSEGRSTATTLISIAAVDEMRRSDLEPSSQKLLSFTDNRQDASLQAGHFNDFASVVLLRSGIYRAVASQPTDAPLTHLNAAQQVFQALNLPQEVYVKDVGKYAGARKRNEEALTALLEYRVYEDLRRSWRVTQPNLEQCGLLTIDYLDLHELCHDSEPWAAHPLLAQCPPKQRETTLRALLNYMRRELAVDAPCLDPDRQGELVRKITAALKEGWAFEEGEQLREAGRFFLPSDETLPRYGRSLSARSALGRFLRSKDAWPTLADKLGEDEYEKLLTALLDILVGANILTRCEEKGGVAFQIRRDALLWRAGDGAPPPPDPIRSRRMALDPPARRQANLYYQRLYQQPAASLRGIEAREHTGQVRQEEREKREEQFRAGELPVLYCSPTMELGIDIADLNVVHMRNVPPTPANYAQRSGRAGRQGQPALVATYCSMGSGHDQYFFQRPQDMVAGVVAPAQIDLANEDLLRAHIQAVWLSFTQLRQLHSMLDLIDTGTPDYPLHDGVKAQLQLSPARQAECITACQRVVDDIGPDRGRMPWFDAGWLRAVIQGAPEAFDRACDRWRELYRVADHQLAQARKLIDLSHQKRLAADEVNRAKQDQDEAMRQKDLLCGVNQRAQADSDFYPYRYLAAEGFLPGYNFPRLPVRAYLPTGLKEGEYVSRPRFLALSEFGPHNIVYHEGRKYRVERTYLPTANPANRFVRARLCRACGYFHDGADAESDLCQNCGTRLESNTAETLLNLFEMTTATTRRVERITSEEEERLREGFKISTHYRFAPGAAGPRRTVAETVSPTGLSLTLSYGQAATIWRINRGWKRAQREGFGLDIRRGTWHAPDEDLTALTQAGAASEVRQGVRIIVHDTRNLLIVEPPDSLRAYPERVASLQYALQYGIEAEFQLEEQELSSERLGEKKQGPILLWEASEGGAGVLRRLVEEPNALARVARAALAICHFDPHTGDEDAAEAGECSRACYRCLLSYTNQPDHGLLNRQAIRDALLQLAQAEVRVREGGPGHGGPPPTLLSPLAQRVLDYIQAHGGRRPAAPPEVNGRRPDLFYPPTFCLLCGEDGDLRDDLEEAGFTVVTLAAEGDLDAQLGAYTFWRE